MIAAHAEAREAELEQRAGGLGGVAAAVVVRVQDVAELPLAELVAVHPHGHVAGVGARVLGLDREREGIAVHRDGRRGDLLAQRLADLLLVARAPGEQAGDVLARLDREQRLEVGRGVEAQPQALGLDRDRRQDRERHLRLGHPGPLLERQLHTRAAKAGPLVERLGSRREIGHAQLEAPVPGRTGGVHHRLDEAAAGATPAGERVHPHAPHVRDRGHVRVDEPARHAVPVAVLLGDEDRAPALLPDRRLVGLLALGARAEGVRCLVQRPHPQLAEAAALPVAHSPDPHGVSVTAPHL